ncbi:MAG: thioesterase [Spirochaetales bacterium]|nr:thioesterase [Spirochaetales bacterium]
MTKYTENIQIRNYHTAPDNKAHIPPLFQFMYEIAGDHGIEQELTIQDMQKDGLSWMLSRMNVEFTRIPSFSEKIKLTTWPTGARGLYSCRDFIMTDNDDNELLRATSAWVTIDFERRRVVRLPQKVLDIHPDPDAAERMIIDNFRGKIQEPENPVIVDNFAATYSTLDANNHVTAPVYVRWLLDALPAEFFNNKNIRKFEIIHKAEILPGSLSKVEYSISGNEIIHAIRPSSGGVVNCLAKSVWE